MKRVPKRQMTLKSSRNLAAIILALTLCGSGAGQPGAARKATHSSKHDESACRSCVLKSANLFASNQLQAAATLLREWSGKCPHNSQLHLLLSTILIRLGGDSLAEAETEATLACEAQPDSQAAHLQYAVTLMAANKNATAAHEFEAVTNLNPGSYEAWSALADLYKRLRQDQAATRAAEKAASLEPGTQAMKLTILQNLKRTGRLDQARTELQRLLSEPQIAPEFEQSLANEAIQMGAYEEAIDACKHVIKAYPKSPGPIRSLAIAQFLKRQYAAARESTDQVLALADRSAEILALRALCRLNQGNTKEAEADLKSAAAIDASAGLVMLADGLIKLARGDFEGADDSLRYACEAYTKGSQFDRVPQSLAHLWLSRLNRKQGLLQEARQEAHAAAGDRRFSAAALALEARTLLADGSRPDALVPAEKLVREALAADAQEPEALLSRSFCEIRSGKLEEARQTALKVCELAPADGDANLALAAVAARNSDPALAKQELEKGLQLASSDPELLFELGSLYLKDNQAAQAVQLLKQAADHRVRGPEICFALAEAFEKNGDAGESLKYYKKSLSQGLSGDNSNQAKAAINRLESSK
jgi:Flp pilus assembly protein TadD